ncbi:hypothetical protein MCERHM32_00417 [Methylophilaceae bacterium]
MKRIRYTEEFKAEAIKQITERGLITLKCFIIENVVTVI